MKKIIFALLLFCASCRNDNYNATFTGFAAAKCYCCWGYEITLDNGDKVKADKFPESLNDFFTRTFPFEGNITYRPHIQCSDVIEIVEFSE